MFSTNAHVRSSASSFGISLPPWQIIAALLAVYFIWGSTYLALHEVLLHIPPFLANGLRYMLAGVLLFGILRWMGEPMPTLRQWRNAALVGSLLAGLSSGLLAFSMQYVASGLAALAVGAIPMWIAMIGSVVERRPSGLELVGLLLGFGGIATLNFGTEIWANPLGGLCLFLAPLIWSIGTMISRHVEMPKGLMSSPTMLMTGGAVLSLAGFLRGEQITQLPSAVTIGAWVYLIIFGSMIAFSAYNYLVQNTPAILATSYAYVNPIVAVFLGWLVLSEAITLQTVIAGGLIITSVLLINLHSARQNTPRPTRMLKP
jgi:drug/metabolite transporter (DMT)-like permease